MNEGWAPARVALGVGRQYGQEQLAAFYTAIGTRIHVRNEGSGRDTMAGALADVGLPPELIELGDIGDQRRRAASFDLGRDEPGRPGCRDAGDPGQRP